MEQVKKNLLCFSFPRVFHVFEKGLTNSAVVFQRVVHVLYNDEYEKFVLLQIFEMIK